ncbi:hypothetical protein E0485_03320 [Paenibacillus albiflavus]|uniref:Uncharacterized protein n=1 Tax=Paenibacillus albiflavus TaxID=2545760 RepID=A0A4R4EN30_9BACL|nr:hypothetical protein [Paenibacillus albiflavus]TCZ79911.1 hypothetical protein E0485_03320 [Paenibacillus albiflavus]
MKAAEQTARNTAVLPDMMLILKEANDKQDEMFEIMVEILAISKAKNKDEAESRFAKVMRKITDLKDNAESIEKLVNYATMAWKAIDTYFN